MDSDTSYVYISYIAFASAYSASGNTSLKEFEHNCGLRYHAGGRNDDMCDVFEVIDARKFQTARLRHGF